MSLVWGKYINKGAFLPHVSFLVVAHNEEEFINNKIKNCLELDYPVDKIEFVFVSSGSTDKTPEIVSLYSERGVKLKILNENRGKSFAINQIVPELNGEIILFSDTRQMFESNSVKELVNNFNDPAVGVVSGELMFSNPDKKREIEGYSLYWNYEKFIRQKESDFHSVSGATGAIYAIRKDFFEPIPEDTILDDVVIPMNILKRGYRVIFEKNAKAWDTISETFKKEFTRKVRTLGGNYQLLFKNPWLFSCKTNPIIFQLISHKLFRLLVPYLLLTLFITNVLIDGTGYRCFLYIQIIVYFFAVVGLKYSSGLFGFLGVFVVLNYASVVGFYKFLTGKLDPSWKVTPKQGEENSRIQYWSFFLLTLFAILLGGAVFCSIYVPNHSYIRIVEVLFWLIVFIASYTYIGYPCIVLIFSLIINKKIERDDIEPTVSMIITAYNEEKDISQKIENTLLLDYPKDKLEIIIASDGSTDNTHEIVKKYADKGVKLIHVEGRVGKTETQNRAVTSSNGEIIVFSDAASMYKKDAIRKIVRNFADNEVGGVCGKCQYVESHLGGRTSVPTRLFWWYETILKKAQTRVGAITGASGLIYAVRRKYYYPLPSDIISDMVEPMMVVKQKKRFVYEPDAIAYEETTSEFKQEFNMRIRVISRGMTGMLFSRSLLNPFKYGWIPFQLFSHKILRWFMPFYMIALLITSAFLLSELLYLIIFIIQIIFYFFSIVSLCTQKYKKGSSVLDILAYICTLASASYIAVIKVICGKQSVVWDTDR